MTHTNEQQPEYPPLFKLKEHTKFLSKNLPVTRMQAQEMIAHYHSCEDWRELLRCQAISAKPKGFNGRRFRQKKSAKISILRDQLEALLVSGIKKGLHKTYQYSLLPNTISHALYQGKINLLLDAEIREFHNNIYDGLDTPQDNIFEEIAYSDNNILNLFFNHLPVRPKLKRWLKDFRYGLEMWVIKFHDDFVIQELDSVFYPTRKPYNDEHFLSRPWALSYLLGYIKHLVQILSSSGKCGRLIIITVQNKKLIDEHGVNKNETITSLVNNLLEQGAISCKPFGDKDHRYGIVLPFGKVTV